MSDNWFHGVLVNVKVGPAVPVSGIISWLIVLVSYTNGVSRVERKDRDLRVQSYMLRTTYHKSSIQFNILLGIMHNLQLS